MEDHSRRDFLGRLAATALAVGGVKTAERPVGSAIRRDRPFRVRTITAGVGVAAISLVGVASTSSVTVGALPTVGSSVAVANGGASNSAVVCADGAALGTLFAVVLGSAMPFGTRVGCACTGPGVPI